MPVNPPAKPSLAKQATTFSRVHSPTLWFIAGLVTGVVIALVLGVR